MPYRALFSATAALASVALLLPAAAQSAPRASATCANSDLAPTAANRPAIRAAVLCLHNEIRSDHGLTQLEANAKLRRAARGHSDDMVNGSFFAHTGPSGATLSDRLRSVRYIRGDRPCVSGENIAWATGILATPAAIMNAWMASPGHRANILRGSYRELGIGIRTGTPTNGADGATYTADFGARH